MNLTHITGKLVEIARTTSPTELASVAILVIDSSRVEGYPVELAIQPGSTIYAQIDPKEIEYAQVGFIISCFLTQTDSGGILVDSKDNEVFIMEPFEDE